uniref:Uncharacterized protein n=1 Tax=Terrapene triunguis TaxID=2587831 RepID=A0A674J8A5_9SAUR
MLQLIYEIATYQLSSCSNDSTSTGDLQPMRTSPAVDMQSPNAQDVLFSSPPQFQGSACHHTD